MPSPINPFKAFRTEELGLKSWKYYIKNKSFEGLLGEHPLIYEGGRGSGKTMFFTCNSWYPQMKMFAQEHQGAIVEYFSKQNIIGFYYVIDHTFIPALTGARVTKEDWLKIFDTYINLSIAKEIALFLQFLRTQSLINESKIIQILSIPLFPPDTEVKEGIAIQDLEAFIAQIDNALDNIEFFTNNNIPIEKLLLYGPGRLVKKLIDILSQIELFENTQFHVLIDEFETLNAEQQVRINTLIKGSKYNLIYNIAVKTKGQKTLATSAESEQIEYPDDYTYYNPEIKEGEERNYNQLLADIVRVRLENHFGDKLEPKYYDIKYYLGEYRFSDELSELEKQVEKFDLLRDEVSRLIEQKVGANDNLKEMIQILTNCDLLNLRLHKSLLLRKTLRVHDIYDAYIEWDKANFKKPTRYHKWLNPAKLNIIFLLCKEFRTTKKYYGFNTYAQLSHGVIRSFLELCQNAFDIAIANGFDFIKPRQLSIDEQHTAAIDTSRLNIKALSKKHPKGKLILNFITNLGDIFYQVLTNPNNTLSDVDISQFWIRGTEKSKEVEDIIDLALMHDAIIQETPTKVDRSSASVEIEDFRINHIFSPYFKISYRKSYKIPLNTGEISEMIKETSKVKRSVLKRLKVISDDLPEQAQIDF
ncbi:MAG: hypothetical protein ABUK01_00015 [Leptospirales bacterium]